MTDNDVALAERPAPKTLRGLHSRQISELRRMYAQLRPEGGRPSKEQEHENETRAILAAFCYATCRLTQTELADKLGISVRTLQRDVARARELNRASVEHTRQACILRAEAIGEVALASGDLKEARLCNADIARFVGVVSTGGNPGVNVAVGVQVNNSADDGTDPIDAWVDRFEEYQRTTRKSLPDPDVVEGELVTDDSENVGE